MPWPKAGATQYHTELGLPDKSRASKGLVVCYLVWLESLGWVCGPAQMCCSGGLLLWSVTNCLKTESRKNKGIIKESNQS